MQYAERLRKEIEKLGKLLFKALSRAAIDYQPWGVIL